MAEEEWVDQFPYSSTSWVSEMLALWLVALSKGPSSPHIFLQLAGCIPSLSHFSNPRHTQVSGIHIFLRSCPWHLACDKVKASPQSFESFNMAHLCLKIAYWSLRPLTLFFLHEFLELFFFLLCLTSFFIIGPNIQVKQAIQITWLKFKPFLKCYSDNFGQIDTCSYCRGFL